jgi:hypothetical protein
MSQDHMPDSRRPAGGDGGGWGWLKGMSEEGKVICMLMGSYLAATRIGLGDQAYWLTFAMLGSYLTLRLLRRWGG